MPDPISVAIMNLEASVAKAIALAEEAARKSARVVTFGETWLPGYPAWIDYCSDAALWDHAPTKEGSRVCARTALLFLAKKRSVSRNSQAITN